MSSFRFVAGFVCTLVAVSFQGGTADARPRGGAMVVTLLEGAQLGGGVPILQEIPAVETGKFRYVTVLGKATRDTAYRCWFGLEPFDSINEATSAVLATCGRLGQEGALPITADCLPPNVSHTTAPLDAQMPVLGPYLGCKVRLLCGTNCSQAQGSVTIKLRFTK